MRTRDQFVPGKSVHSLYISFVLSDGMKLPLGIFFYYERESVYIRIIVNGANFKKERNNF